MEKTRTITKGGVHQKSTKQAGKGEDTAMAMTRVNSANVLDGGLRIGEIGRQMNSKVNSVKQGGHESKHGCKT
jgi:hypothetical protein